MEAVQKNLVQKKKRYDGSSAKNLGQKKKEKR